MTRDDLLRLDEDDLSSLTSRGLVRRAQKLLERGRGPAVSIDEEGILRGRFPDGTTVTIRPGDRIGPGLCTCAAMGACHHLTATLLAYRAAASEAPTVPEDRPWSPSRFEGEPLARWAGRRVLRAAERLLQSGTLVVDLQPGVQPRAVLPSATVRFLEPDALDYAVCDCASEGPCAHVVLAVRAFAALERGAARPVVLGRRSEPLADVAETLEEASRVARALLCAGVARVPAWLRADLERVRRSAQERDLTWLAEALRDLEEQIEAYLERRADHAPPRWARALLEVELRCQASRGGAPLPQSYVLGTGLPRAVEMARARLLSLGVRLEGAPGAERAAVYLLDPTTATVLVLCAPMPGLCAATPSERARRLLAPGVVLEDLAFGQIVTRKASRLASRRLTLRRGARGATTVVPQRGDWEQVPWPVRVGGVEALDALWRERPPALVRPRVEAEDLHVLPVAAVEEVAYLPEEQALVARLLDPDGAPFEIRLEHRAAAPGALDALGRALQGDPPPRFVSGPVRRGPRGPVVEPVALVGDRLVVPDLARGDETWHGTPPATPWPVDPLWDGLQAAWGLLEAGAHRGVRHAPPSWAAEVAQLGARMRSLGIEEGARRLAALASAARDAPQGKKEARRAAAAWMEAAGWIHLLEEARPLSAGGRTQVASRRSRS